MKDISFFDEHRLAVIPLLPQSKKPILDEWQKRTFEENNESEFQPDSNIGVVLGEASNGIVDIDLDTPVAIKLAPLFLPETGWKFGRETALNSHRVYRIKGQVGTRKAIMLDGETFAEYRADGCMTVFPESIHGETGEKIEWSKCEAPAVASRDELIGGLKKMAIIAAVMPNYKKGSRNNVVNALTGALLFYGMAINDIKHIVGVLCDVTNDEEATDRIKCVETTAQRKSANQSVTGEEQLRELIGNDAVASIIGYLGGQKNSVSAVIGPVSSTSSAVFSDDEKNDTGVGKRFAEAMGAHVAYVEELGSYFTYNGQTWKHDSGVKIDEIFDTFVMSALDKLRADNNIQHAEQNRQSKFLLKYRNCTPSKKAIEKSKSAMLLPMSKLDANRDLIAVKNGVLNLRTGELLDFDPSYYITRQLAIEFNPKATCPKFESFLNTTFNGDNQLIDYVQGILGYAMTPSVNRQELYFLHGIGANGKSAHTTPIRPVILI